MEFVLRTKNFEVSHDMLGKLNTTVRKLGRPMMTFAHFEKAGDIIVEKLPIGGYKTKINFHLPKHSVSVEKGGFTPQEAVKKATLEAREKVIRLKELEKNIHTKQRKAHA